MPLWYTYVSGLGAIGNSGGGDRDWVSQGEHGRGDGCREEGARSNFAAVGVDDMSRGRGRCKRWSPT